MGSVIKDLDETRHITIVSEEPYPEYTACLLADYLCGEIGDDMIFLKKVEDYEKEGIAALLGHAVTRVDADTKAVFLGSQSLPYDKLVIATGSRPHVPPIEGKDKKGVFTFKTLADVKNISCYPGDSAVVVGSGPIGVEASIALRRKGLQVCLVELLEGVMPLLFDETPSLTLKDVIERNGIKVFTNEKVLSILGGRAVEGVLTDRREIKCDMVIVVAGMRPNVELAESMGVNVGGLGGIKTDARMLTNIDDVYACGDCIESRDLYSGRETLSLLWHNAKLQAEVAGHGCVGSDKIYSGSLGITGVNVFGVHAVSFGQTARTLKNSQDLRTMERTDGDSHYRLILQGNTLVGAQGIGKTLKMGLLLSLMQKGTDIRKHQEFLRAGEFLDINPWSYRVQRFFN